MIKANRVHLTTIWSATAKGLNAHLNERFQILIFNKLAKLSQNMFSFYHFVLLSVDLWANILIKNDIYITLKYAKKNECV